MSLHRRTVIKVLPDLLHIHSETQSKQQGNSLRTHIVTNRQQSFGLVAKIWDVVVGVTPVTLGGVVRNSQMVKSRKENEEPYDDDGNGAVRMLKATNRNSD